MKIRDLVAFDRVWTAKMLLSSLVRMREVSL
jgi:hypothetical protein